MVVFDKELVEEAKGIVAASMLEPLKALTRGIPCPSCARDDGFARLADGDVKTIAKEAVSSVFKLLWLRANEPESYQRELRSGRARMRVGDDLGAA